MIFHEKRNRLLADDSHQISFLISFENWARCHKICCLLQIVGGALRVSCLSVSEKVAGDGDKLEFIF